MKYTLLELTQAVLSSMDSDEINSIDDTPESQQVVTVIKTVYDDIISRGDLQTNKTPFNLVPSGDLTTPVLMSKPESIDHIHWLKYNTRNANDTTDVWSDMVYLPFMDFVDYMHNYNTDETNVDSFTFSSEGFLTTFNYKTDTAPRYYTTFNDELVVFDAYDSEVDAFLQASKTLGYGAKRTDFQAIDSFVPALQPQQFALLLNEAKSLAWAELKQTVHAKAENTARKNWIHLQRTRLNIPDGKTSGSNAHNFDRLPNYSRPR